MKPVFIDLFQFSTLTQLITQRIDVEIGKIVLREFPDQESYLKIENSVSEKEVIILASLDRPNAKILPLLFLVDMLKELGAKRIGLCAPYLAYMRQDKRFHAGEGITSTYFAALLSRYFDWIVTIDPHLHRRHDLSEIYSIPNSVLHAASTIAQWIVKHIKKPILIGPDSESEQWVSQVAKEANAPYLVLEKIRQGDRSVKVSLPQIESYRDHIPVLVDDIISTAHTMLETIAHLKNVNMKTPVCIGVHAVFADHSDQLLQQAGVAQVVTCNTIAHPSNQIDLSSLLVSGIRERLKFMLLRDVKEIRGALKGMSTNLSRDKDRL